MTQRTDSTRILIGNHSCMSTNRSQLFNMLNMVMIVIMDFQYFGSLTINISMLPLVNRKLQTGANVLFFTFINPATMEVPLSYQKLGFLII